MRARRVSELCGVRHPGCHGAQLSRVFWVRQNKLEWNSWDNRIVAMVYIEERRVDNGIGRKVSW